VAGTLRVSEFPGWGDSGDAQTACHIGAEWRKPRPARRLRSLDMFLTAAWELFPADLAPFSRRPTSRIIRCCEAQVRCRVCGNLCDWTGMTEEPSTGTPRERIEHILLPILEEVGLELYELDVSPSSGRIAITLDRKGLRGPGTGVTLEETVKVARQLRYLLETTGTLNFEWSLEVGSPGIERDLKTAAHFVSSVGERVRLVLDVEVNGSKLLEGRLVSADESLLVIEKSTGEKLECKPNDVRRGRTVFDFSVYDSTPKRAARPPRARAERSADSDTAPTSTEGKKR